MRHAKRLVEGLAEGASDGAEEAAKREQRKNTLMAALGGKDGRPGWMWMLSTTRPAISFFVSVSVLLFFIKVAFVPWLWIVEFGCDEENLGSPENDAEIYIARGLCVNENGAMCARVTANTVRM